MKILLYGATGFSGELIARAAMQRWSSGPVRYELLLGGRDGRRLAELGREIGAGTRVFSLDDSDRVDAALGEPGIYAVINAAGPFAWTALPLARSALRTGRHYVDINGEADVYKTVDDLAFIAEGRKLAMVVGAGHSAATSDIMLELALHKLAAINPQTIGTIRIVFSHVKYTSQGSAQTAWRSVREQVTVMRSPVPPIKTGQELSLVAAHVPAGQIERAFDFGDRDYSRRQGDAGGSSTGRRQEDRLRATGSRRIATAANLLDLYTARLTAQRHMNRKGEPKVGQVQRIEAYIEMPEGARVFTQFGSLSAAAFAFPAVRRIVRWQVGLLPEGPDQQERANDRHTVLLQIDDGAGKVLIDWRIETPDPYDFTSDCVLGVIEGLPKVVASGAGWRTPGELFEIQGAVQSSPVKRLFASCQFEQRVGKLQ